RIARELLDERAILRNADAIGVDHHMTNRPLLHGVENVEESRMNGRLTARQLDEVGLAFAGDENIEHPLDLLNGTVAPVNVCGAGKAYRAGEIAGLVDLNDREAAVLLMIRAQAAVERTACLGPRLGRKRPVAGLDPQFLLAPIV